MKTIKDHIKKHLTGLIAQSGQTLSSAQGSSVLAMNEQNFFSMCVPHRYKDAQIDFLDLQTEFMKEVGREWAKNPCSVFIFGPTGTGKTRFSFAMIREMFRRCSKQIWPRYYTSPELDMKLHKEIMEGGDAHMIHRLSEEDLLFIDDFGRESKSDRVKRQYFEIINSRYANGRPTMITSNFTIDEIGQMFGDVISSRLEEFKPLLFDGKDLRKILAPQPIFS